ncbi:hypothetical protein D6D19_08800 [Aureobasidium pullulans]|uniref:DUF8035 domain-containing protein n=1 Tax=Aureobasidium pullulans TaxID=5580 RepID=A0A4S8ZR60_AURPU|nr:hypothetical protein D6D19_08800 [Aureobasidium pullulans]
MSRSNYGRHSSSDLAYGEEPQRWDRDRFERYSRRAPAPVAERETFRFSEHDRPGHQDIRIEERIDRGPPPRREREFAEDAYGPAARPRRSDRELFGDRDPRELADLQLAPYRRKSIVDREFEFRETRNVPRPGLQRRQSSLDTFDRRPLRQYERDEYRIPAGVPIPLPRRRSPSRGPPGGWHEEEYEDVRRRDYSPQASYRDVEIMREKSVHRRRGHRDRARSDARSVTTKRSGRSARSSSSSSASSVTEVSRHSSPGPAKIGKKGKTRMPKRLVRKEAIINLGYPFVEEEDFIIVQRALDKEHIDEVIRISEQYKEPKTKTYRYDDPGAPPEEHFEHLRTEWINPPSVRAPSPARSSRTRRSSPARTVRQPSPMPPPQPQTIYIQNPAPAPPPAPIYIREQAPPPPPAPIYIQEPSRPAPPQQQPMIIALPEHRRDRSRDYHADVRALEAEARALRLERESHHHNHGQIVLARPEQSGYEMVEYRERRPDREIEYVERDRSPKREVIRVEKDRKAADKERRQARKIAMMMATLS